MLGFDAICLVMLTFDGCGDATSVSPDSTELISVVWSSRGTMTILARCGTSLETQYFVLGTRTSWDLLQDCRSHGPPEYGTLVCSTLEMSVLPPSAAAWSTSVRPPKSSGQSA